jgi:hypothetical protein
VSERERERERENTQKYDNNYLELDINQMKAKYKGKR